MELDLGYEVLGRQDDLKDRGKLRQPMAISRLVEFGDM